jgi:ech hydrogenase subunit F
MEDAMLEFLSVIMKNAFHRPATRNYPRVSRAPYEKQKGHIDIDLPACIYCGICSKKCPTGAIEVVRGERLWSIDRFKCIQCNACVESCPKKCLSMGSQYTAPAGEKTVEIFQMPKGPKPAEPATAGKGENRGA